MHVKLVLIFFRVGSGFISGLSNTYLVLFRTFLRVHLSGLLI